GGWNGKVRVVSAGIRVTNYVEPVPPPSLAVLLGGKQSVHNLFECAGRGVFQERLYLLRSWREPGEVKRGSPDQHSLVGIAHRYKAFRHEFGQYEAVDRRAGPRLSFGSGRLSIADRLKRPELSLFSIVIGLPVGRSRSGIAHLPWVRSAHRNPRFDILYLLVS